jgi:hypothetical protein
VQRTRLAEILSSYSVIDLVEGISPEGASELLAVGRRIMGKVYYPHQCIETGRWFVCLEGEDDNLCECFDWGGKTAEEMANGIANALNFMYHRIMSPV